MPSLRAERYRTFGTPATRRSTKNCARRSWKRRSPSPVDPVRTGVIGNKRTGEMGYTSGHYVLENCKPYGRDYSLCDVGAACAIYGERTVRAVRDQSQDWL